MACKYCKKKIGRIRGFFDRDFCCHAHRVIFERAKPKGDRVYSARLIREIEGVDFDGLNQTEPIRKPKPGMPMGLVLCLMLGVVLVFLWLPRSGQSPVPQAGSGYALPSSGWMSSFWSSKLSIPSIRLTENFTSGLSDWRSADPRGVTGVANDWIYRAGSVRPGRLCLWAPSLKLTDYTFGFHAAIEKNGLGWAFRAANRANHYGARIEILRPGRQPVTNIIHYAMVNGKEQDRVELPLPLSVSTDALYDVTVKIRGNRFVTSVNSQVVDTWTDNRLKTGGVGFFANKGDVSSVLSVNVSTERSLWDRIFASFVLMPPLSMAD